MSISEAGCESGSRGRNSFCVPLLSAQVCRQTRGQHHSGRMEDVTLSSPPALLSDLMIVQLQIRGGAAEACLFFFRVSRCT